MRVLCTARRSKQSILKEINPEYSLERLLLKLKLLLWPPDMKSQLDGEDPDAGKDCRQEEKEVTEDEMVGWHHWLNGHEFFANSQFSSVAQSCPTLCDPMNHSMPGLPVHHHLPEFTQTHIHRVCDAIQPSHPRSSPSPPAPNPSQHQSLFQ